MSDREQDMKKEKLTSVTGAPVPDNQNSLTAGPRGPLLMQDVWFLEKLAHFDREVIPERRMHAKGSGAFGVFTVTHDITKYTKAKIFSEIGKKTEMFVRFSTVAGERGAADAERDIRGFAMKFYTEEGNWDLVGNNTPVFFLRDPLKFPDLNHAVKRDPRTNLRSAKNNWDFWSSLPEALHQVTITMSDRGIPFSYRHMHGFGSHAFSMINGANERVWVKFHFHTQQGIKNLTDQEAEAIVGKCRESHQRDLYEAIERGEFPKWTMFIQVMTEEQANNMPYNPFDLTKVWYKKDYPLIEVGHFELNKNPDNYFRDVEQAAFNPASVVPGISFSPTRCFREGFFLRRRPAVPPRGEPPPDTGECAPVPGEQLPQGRADAGGRQRGKHHRLRAQQLRQVAGAARVQGSSSSPFRGGLAVEFPGGRRRLLYPAGIALPAHEPGAAEGSLREHRPEFGRCPEGDQGAPHRKLPEGRPGLRQGSGRRPRDFPRRSEIARPIPFRRGRACSSGAAPHLR